MIEEDVEAKRKKADESRAKMEEAVKINKAAIKMRRLQAEAEAEEEMRRLEFLKAKAEREEAEEQRLEEEKKQKELVFREQLRQQERVLDMRGARDELAAKRAQYEKERQLRAKEAAEAEAKAKAQAELHRAREAQIQAQIEMKVQQAVADQYDFERTLAAQKKLIETSKHIEEEQKKRALKHKDEVQAQISEREKQLIKERAEFFKEGVKIDEEAQLRRARINAIKERMLADVEAEGIEPHYLQDVKREVVKA